MMFCLYGTVLQHQKNMLLKTQHFCLKKETEVLYFIYEFEADEKVVGTAGRNLFAGQGVAPEGVPQRQAVVVAHARYPGAG
jgi:hypothetical protein